MKRECDYNKALYTVRIELLAVGSRLREVTKSEEPDYKLMSALYDRQYHLNHDKMNLQSILYHFGRLSECEDHMKKGLMDVIEYKTSLLSTIKL